ncbi:16S rRNA (cytidine(1402)-2'-O)-methyltransferase [Ferrimicrobium sp.]|uniref:16S rRNA (cytidine(1402)-2'-O)-methyltransferase n=1 Tax=Ferrimicrobium sp. TaxID=2926050 RepID=UPI002617281F|nr:16S rRNA (cytidine(1402)-2'-O)-methyltransferase [Ferrimicrobium sp.]
MSHTLFVVGTPIGNLGDLSPRARECLSTVDLVIAEDTRVFARLCHLVGLVPRAVRGYQGRQRIAEVEFLSALEGGDVALVSDAGMPGVSDPGSEFVALALAHGNTIRAIPGASALTTALALWPMAVDAACFYGFLPRRGSERARMVTNVMSASSVGVILESPRRLYETCAELAALDPSRHVLLLGELTKLHESMRWMTLAEALEVLRGVDHKGEWVIVVEQAQEARPSGAESDRLLRALATSSLGTKEAAAIYAQVQEVAHRDAYQLMLSSRSEGTLSS